MKNGIKWMQDGPDEMADKFDIPRFLDDELYEYLKKHNDVGSGVTLNIGIYNDSTLIDETIDQLCRIR